MNYENKARILYEYHISNVHNRVDDARQHIEKILIKIDDISMTDEDKEALEELSIKALSTLDRITN